MPSFWIWTEKSCRTPSQDTKLDNTVKSIVKYHLSINKMVNVLLVWRLSVLNMPGAAFWQDTLESIVNQPQEPPLVLAYADFLLMSSMSSHRQLLLLTVSIIILVA